MTESNGLIQGKEPSVIVFRNVAHTTPRDNKEQIVFGLKSEGITAAHFTNGTYAHEQRLIVPTVLAGFQYVADNEAVPGAALVIAVNSNASMWTINQKLRSTKSVEDEWQRLYKVGVPLAFQHPDRKVAVILFDEETPNALYNSLRGAGINMVSLFKWGYGTDPKGGLIEGAENFGNVYGFPLPNDIKPVCVDITRPAEQQAGTVSVVDLCTTLGPHGNAYISVANECLFPLAGELLEYGPRNNPVKLAADSKLTP
jgi:hypothetical protein